MSLRTLEETEKLIQHFRGFRNSMFPDKLAS